MNLLLNLKMVRPDTPEEILKDVVNWFYALSDETLNTRGGHHQKVNNAIWAEYSKYRVPQGTSEASDAFHVLIARAPASMDSQVRTVVQNAAYISGLGNSAEFASRVREAFRNQDRLWKAG